MSKYGGMARGFLAGQELNRQKTEDERRRKREDANDAWTQVANTQTKALNDFNLQRMREEFDKDVRARQAAYEESVYQDRFNPYARLVYGVTQGVPMKIGVDIFNSRPQQGMPPLKGYAFNEADGSLDLDFLDENAPEGFLRHRVEPWQVRNMMGRFGGTFKTADEINLEKQAVEMAAAQAEEVRESRQDMRRQRTERAERAAWEEEDSRLPHFVKDAFSANRPADIIARHNRGKTAPASRIREFRKTDKGGLDIFYEDNSTHSVTPEQANEARGMRGVNDASKNDATLLKWRLQNMAQLNTLRKKMSYELTDDDREEMGRLKGVIFTIDAVLGQNAGLSPETDEATEPGVPQGAEALNALLNAARQ